MKQGLISGVASFAESAPACSTQHHCHWWRPDPSPEHRVVQFIGFMISLGFYGEICILVLFCLWSYYVSWCFWVILWFCVSFSTSEGYKVVRSLLCSLSVPRVSVAVLLPFASGLDVRVFISVLVISCFISVDLCFEFCLISRVSLSLSGWITLVLFNAAYTE